MDGNKRRKHKWWCVVCGSDEEDELKFGQLCRTKDFNVHHFCLLLSSTFEQRGKDSEGVYGFRIKDIEYGLELIKDTTCWYCGYGNASIYCSHEGCRRAFHLTCGVISGCLSQFLGNFDSFCHRHNDEFRYKYYKDESCVICRDPLKFTCDAVETDCCKSVFHRRCLGALALSAGYFFKCPLCNNTDQFRRCMREKGIYVPDRDASWELENNAFHELYSPVFKCEAAECLSKRGREYNAAHGFAFMSCSSCGASSVHRNCCPTPDYVCEICSALYSSSAELDETGAHDSTAALNNSTMLNSSLMLNETLLGASPFRRTTRGLQRRNGSPEKPRSPFKLRNRELGGPPKRRRLQ